MFLAVKYLAAANMEDTSTDTSLKKTLISFDEYKRLKNIEAQFLKLQEEKQKNLEISSGTNVRKSCAANFRGKKVIRTLFLNFFFFSGSNHQKTQSGEGLIDHSQKKYKKLKLEKLIDDESDSEDEKFYQKIVNKVAQKLTNTSPSTNLWHSSLSPATATLLSSETSPPLPYQNDIKKDDENDIFGEFIL